MLTLTVTTQIDAPRQRCFDLARSIDLHIHSTAQTSERAVAGVTAGLIGLNQTVTFEARHLGVRQRLTSRITAFAPPEHFRDEMVPGQGAFQALIHDHHFVEASPNQTTMIDTLTFAAPLGPLGWLAERLVLGGHMKRFLKTRNATLKQVAESDEWKRFLQA